MMEVQRYEELDKLCKEMEQLMSRAIQETLERYCKVNVYYFFSHDTFCCEADVDCYGVTISASCLIGAPVLREVSQDEFRELGVDYTAVLVSRLKESMKRIGVGNEKGKV